MNLKNSALQDLYDTIVNGTFTFSPGEASPIDKAFRECDEKLSDSVTFTRIKDLQDRNDILEESNKSLLAGNLNLSTEKSYLKNQISRLEELLLDANTTLEKANADRTELQEVCDKLSEENKRLNARTDSLRLEVNWYRKHYKEQSDKIRELKFRLNRGQTDLWDMLQNVNDAKPFELATCFPDVSCMDDILSWELEDFLDAYKSWQEKKDQERIKHMRDYLERFCMGRFCYNCPLHTVGLLCERGKRFCDMSDEDLKKYYEKARAFSKPMCHKDGWTCTLEGTVEINKDLLNKVYGIDSDD